MWIYYSHNSIIINLNWINIIGSNQVQHLVFLLSCTRSKNKYILWTKTICRYFLPFVKNNDLYLQRKIRMAFEIFPISVWITDKQNFMVPWEQFKIYESKMKSISERVSLFLHLSIYLWKDRSVLIFAGSRYFHKYMPLGFIFGGL